MQKSTIEQPSIRLMERETLRLLRRIDLDFNFTHYEERLFCGLLQASLFDVRPNQIADISNKTVKEKQAAIRGNETDTISVQCVIRMNAAACLAQLTVTSYGHEPILLTIFERYTRKFEKKTRLVKRK